MESVAPSVGLTAMLPENCKRLDRWAILLWSVLTLVCATQAYLKPRSHTVYPIYTYAAGEWQAGRDIYVKLPGYDYFRYSPVVANFFVPLRLLGDAVGGALWRILGVALLTAGLLAWSRCIWLPEWSRDKASLLFLLVTPFLLQNANNGQSNPHLLGLVLLGAANVCNGRIWLAALWFALAIHFKPYLFAISALMALQERRLWLRLSAVIVAIAAIPFLFQSPSYVADRYVEWLHHLTGNDRAILDVRSAYRDVGLLFRMYATTLPPAIYLGGSAIVGLFLAAIAWRSAKPEIDKVSRMESAFGLGCCWATVFGPATESCTYLMLAPALAMRLLSKQHSSLWLRISYSLFVATIAASLFPDDWKIQVLGPQPIAGLIALAVLIADARSLRENSVEPTVTRVAA